MKCTACYVIPLGFTIKKKTICIAQMSPFHTVCESTGVPLSVMNTRRSEVARQSLVCYMIVHS